jgi:hypothetical protein
MKQPIGDKELHFVQFTWSFEQQKAHHVNSLSRLAVPVRNLVGIAITTLEPYFVFWVILSVTGSLPTVDLQ